MKRKLIVVLIAIAAVISISTPILDDNATGGKPTVTQVSPTTGGKPVVTN